MGHLKAEVINNENDVSSHFMFSQVKTRCQSGLEVSQSETHCVVPLQGAPCRHLCVCDPCAQSTVCLRTCGSITCTAGSVLGRPSHHSCSIKWLSASLCSGGCMLEWHWHFCGSPSLSGSSTEEFGQLALFCPGIHQKMKKRPAVMQTSFSRFPDGVHFPPQPRRPQHLKYEKQKGSCQAGMQHSQCKGKPSTAPVEMAQDVLQARSVSCAVNKLVGCRDCFVVLVAASCIWAISVPKPSAFVWSLGHFYQSYQGWRRVVGSTLSMFYIESGPTSSWALLCVDFTLSQVLHWAGSTLSWVLH
ncbi:uncharacterized protein LOC122188195 [Lagopus leucura]|uniref:uncharacterized protein LOC122188195 n=1 Tax=Lagopus leucura TaxID=30410 RepID=UPI001C66FB53|nr:uncharacterized protein LOC122188195 [Lagopus leucura]XP_042742234.1 uncharacterized protein LOC122188195 [Lagopus leucura]XP_042742237.1 uncharacterized protein LOC122188195 [Lagopus leucura]